MTVHQKCEQCIETEHFPDCTSEMCTVHRKRKHFPGAIPEMCTVHRKRTLSRLYVRNMYCAQKRKTLSRRYIRNVYSAQKKNTFQAVCDKCVMCTETEYFPVGTHKTVFTDHKTTFKKETQLFTVIQIHQHMQLTHNKSHT